MIWYLKSLLLYPILKACTNDLVPKEFAFIPNSRGMYKSLLLYLILEACTNDLVPKVFAFIPNSRGMYE